MHISNESGIIRKIIWWFVAVLFSTMIIAGIILDLKAPVSNGIYLGVIILLLSCPIYFCLSWIDHKLQSMQVHIGEAFNKRQLMCVYVVIVLVWFAGYLAMFPGVYATDAQYWYYEFANSDVPISSQWSPVYAGIYYFFLEMGLRFWGSEVIGFGIFTLLQMAWILYGVWSIIRFINRVFGRVAALCAAAFFIFVPTHNILSVSSAQDGIFALAFAMSLLHLIRIVFGEENYWDNCKNPIAFCGWLLVSCIVRNNGFYAILVVAFFTVCFATKWKARILTVFTVAMIATLVYQGPLYAVFGVQKGTAVREMLSLPLQQMAYAYNFTGDLSPEVCEEMHRYIPEESWGKYQPCISDQIKNSLNVSAVEESLLDFAKLYVKVGLESPKGYLIGAAYQTYGLWYPFKEYPDERTWHPYIDYASYTSDLFETGIELTRHSLFPMYEEMLAWLFGAGETWDGFGGHLFIGFSDIPLWNLICKAGTYTWLVIFMLVYLLLHRKYKALVPLGYVIGILLTVVLSPVIMYRYVAPVIFSAPLWITLLWLANKPDGLGTNLKEDF